MVHKTLKKAPKTPQMHCRTLIRSPRLTSLLALPGLGGPKEAVDGDVRRPIGSGPLASVAMRAKDSRITPASAAHSGGWYAWAEAVQKSGRPRSARPLSTA